MVRLLLICLVFLLLYLGFAMIGQLDSSITINLYDYYIQSSFIAFIALYVLSTIIMIIIIKVMSLIINLPSSLKSFLLSHKTNNANYHLMCSMAESMIGNKSNSVVMKEKIAINLDQDNKIFYTLLLAENQQDDVKKIQYLQELEQSTQYKLFACKKLAQIFYQNHNYQKSENYAVIAFNYNEFDSEILEILLDCYYELSLWTQLIFILSKITKIDKQKLDSIKNKVAGYYFRVAKYMLEINDSKNAISYLESAIQILPSHYDSLNLYLTLNFNSLTKNNQNIAILETAFRDNPSFEIAELYQKFGHLSCEKIYDNLTMLVDPTKYLGLFLSIAAYLELPEKITNLKKTSKLLSFYQKDE